MTVVDVSFFVTALVTGAMLFVLVHAVDILLSILFVANPTTDAASPPWQLVCLLLNAFFPSVTDVGYHSQKHEYMAAPALPEVNQMNTAGYQL